MANGIFDITQSDAQLQAILNKIQPLANTGDMATLGFGYGVCSYIVERDNITSISGAKGKEPLGA